MEKTIFQKLACLGFCLLLAACSSSPPEVPVCCTVEGVTLAPKKATSRPYQIKGVWYYPQPHYEYAEEGLASFYGGGDIFHGRPTATGERFDMNGVTAAHKTVPLPCMAKVTNLENGRELIVKVNDRGPFVEGRIIDLSRRSAQLLGFENKGIAKVRVVTLVPESLALNGIDPATVMMADAGSIAPSNPALCPVPPLEMAPSDESEALVEALDAPSTIDNLIPSETVMAAAAASSPEPIIEKITSVLPEPDLVDPEPILMAEAPPPPTPPTSANNPPPLPVKAESATSTGIFVHVGAYKNKAMAHSVSQTLQSFTQSPIKVIKNSGPTPYAASVGPFPSMAQANQMLDQLVNAGHLISRIVIQR